MIGAPTNFMIKRQQGFTLIELLAALAVFVVVVGAFAGVFISTLQTVKTNLAEQQAFDGMRYALEYMARAIRQADPATISNSCGTGQTCLQFDRPDTVTLQFSLYCDASNSVSCTPNSIVIAASLCKKNQFFYCNQGASATECPSGTCTGSARNDRLTPPDVVVDSLNFVISGTGSNQQQPRVTIASSFHYKNPVTGASSKELQLQTTVALRRLIN